MGKTRDRSQKIRDTKGTFHAKMDTIKDRNVEKEMATNSSILAWKSPWTEEPGPGCSPWGYITEHVCMKVEGVWLVPINR